MSTWAALRGHSWKYVETDHLTPSGEIIVYREYYDLRVDAREQVNVMMDGVVGNEPSAGRLAALADRLAAARTCDGANCP